MKNHSGEPMEGFEKVLEATGDFKVLESGLLPAGDIKTAISNSQEKVKELQNILVDLDSFIANSMVEMENILEMLCSAPHYDRRCAVIATWLPIVGHHACAVRALRSQTTRCSLSLMQGDAQVVQDMAIALISAAFPVC